VRSFAVTSSEDRTQYLPASLSAFLCGGLEYGRSAATLITPSASHPPLLPPGRRGGSMGRLSTLKLPCMSLRSAAVTFRCAIR
jgi:hypothetical protein